MTKISINTKIKAVEEYVNGTASLTANLRGNLCKIW